MELQEIYNRVNKDLKISFEVFPPKNGDIASLFEKVRILKKYNPAFISITYGANGGTRNLSFELIKSFLDLELNVMPHLTCVGATRELIEHYVTEIENLSIENILALRGDITETLKPVDFNYANELVEFIHSKTTLSIGVAGYPEGHFEAKDLETDIENLKNKINAGASAIFTQLFLDNEKFYSYIELVRKSGISVPVIPGIMPIRNLKQLEKMTSMAKVSIPRKLIYQLEKFPSDTIKIGTEFAIHQCQELIDNGIDALHFFTLNHAGQVSEILDNIL